MSGTSTAPGRLLATSDLHVAFPENRKIVEDLWPESDADWLLVAGDIGEKSADIEWALSLLAKRFSTVIWTPGNHELWTPRDGVRFEEVSVGYPREQRQRGLPRGTLRQILPYQEST